MTVEKKISVCASQSYLHTNYNNIKQSFLENYLTTQIVVIFFLTIVGCLHIESRKFKYKICKYTPVSLRYLPTRTGFSALDCNQMILARCKCPKKKAKVENIDPASIANHFGQ